MALKDLRELINNLYAEDEFGREKVKEGKSGLQREDCSPYVSAWRIAIQAPYSACGSHRAGTLFEIGRAPPGVRLKKQRI